VARQAKEMGQLAAGLDGYEPPVIPPDLTGLKDSLRSRDVQRVERWLLERQEVAERGQTFGARVFDGASYLPGWMIEFALTGGLGKLGSQTAQEVAARTLQGYAKTTGGQMVLKAAGWTGGAITRASLGLPHRVAEEILERRIPAITIGENAELSIGVAPESWATSIAKGWGSVVIEAATETAGTSLAAGAKWTARQSLGRLPFGRQFYGQVRQAWLALHPEEGAAAAFVERFFTRTGYDGILEELGEERLNTILSALAETENYTQEENPSALDNLAAGLAEDLKLKNLAVEATVLAVPGAAKLAVGAAAGRIAPASKEKGTADGLQGQGQETGQGQVAGPDGSRLTPSLQDAARTSQGGASTTKTPEGPALPATGVWDDAVDAAEKEAVAQARERYRGPDQFTFQDLLPELAKTTDEQDLRRRARALGIKAEGLSGENLRKFIADAVVSLTQESPEPAAVLEGEPHPGSLTWKKFFERYGQALASPKTPENQAWLQRYAAQEAERGPRGLYRSLQAEFHRQTAWDAFYELTGQMRPEAGEAERADSRSQIGAEFPTTEAEAREENVRAETAQTEAALGELAAQPAAQDLPPEPVQGPTPGEVGIIRHLLHRLGIKDKDGYTPLGETDFREIYKLVQLPEDVARRFRSFGPVYGVQRGRERAKEVLDRVFAEKLQPYFDLTDGERKAVDEALIAQEQQPGEPQARGAALQGLSEKQYAAYQSVRRGLDDAAELLVERMKQLGVAAEQIREFEARIGGYIPHKWYGGWAVVAKEKLTPEQMKEQQRRPQTLYMTAVGYTERFRERERLQGLFPNAEVSILKRTKMPYEAYQDAPLATVAKMVDLIIEQAKSKTAGRADLTDETKNQLADALKDVYKAKGFGMHFIHRSEVPGWTEDLRRPLAEYFAGFSGFLTKMEAGLQFAEALDAIDPRRQPNLYKYASEYIRYVMGDQQEFGRLKSLAYYWYMFGNIKSAATNLTGNLVMGWPVLSKHTNLPLARLMHAGVDTAAGHLSAAEKTFLDDLEKQGYLDPKMAAEISARGGNAIYQMLSSPVKKMVSWVDVFRTMERFNRRSMAVALHRAGITDPAAAAAIVEEAHFHYGKGNRPTLSRGLSSPLMVFRSYTINQLTWMKNQIKAGVLDVGRGEIRKAITQDALPLLWSMTATILLGGVRALPFAGALFALYSRIAKRDPEGDMRDALGDTAGEILARGVPSQGGVSLTGSVSMNDIVPTVEPGQEWDRAVGEWVLGVAGDIPVRAARVGQDLAGRQYLRALEDFAPEALKNPLAAWRLYSRGMHTRRGNPVLDLETAGPLRLNEAETALKALGFQPDKIREQFDLERTLKIIGGEKQIQKQRWADRLYLAAQQGDMPALQEVMQDWQQYDRAVRADGRDDLRIAWKDIEDLANNRARPINAPGKTMLDTYGRIWRQYYGKD
jgi:hypothetical protein